MEIIRIILPIAIFVLTVVYIIKTVNKKAKQDKENIEEDNEKEDNEENNYMAEGMAIGMGSVSYTHLTLPTNREV